MARKPKEKGPDNFANVFGALFKGVLEIDFAQFLHDHLGLIGLLIDAARNGDEITLEMLKEADLGEFQIGGENSDLSSQFQLAVFLQKAAEQYDFNPLPWMEQQEEPPVEKKPRRKPAKKKTAGSGSAASAAVEKLGNKEQVIELLKEHRSLPALAKYLKGRGVTIQEQNLRDTLNRHYGLKISEVLSGAPAKKKTARRQASGNVPVAETVANILGGKATAKKALRAAGSVEELLKRLQKKASTLTVTNLRYVLNKKIGISTGDVLKGRSQRKKTAKRKTTPAGCASGSTGQKPPRPQETGGESVTQQAIRYLKNADTAASKLIRAGTVSALAQEMRDAGIDISNANTSIVLKNHFGFQPRDVLAEAAGTK